MPFVGATRAAMAYHPRTPPTIPAMTHTRHRSHGLADDETAPDWAPLERGEVAALLEHYPALDGQPEILWRSPRPFSAAARVRTDHGEVFVKRHHPGVRTPAMLREEHDFIAHLRAHGLPVPEVLAHADGDTVMTFGPWTWEVHACADGIDLYRDHVSWAPLTDTGQARRAGRMLARLHLAAAGYRVPQRTAWMLVARDDLLRADDPVSVLARQLLQRPALAEYLARRDWKRDLTPLLARMQRIQPRIAALPPLWTHNDWHVSNLFWSDTGAEADVSAIVDFGLASPTFALYDLATAIERNAIAWLHLERGMEAIFPAIARQLVAGYDDIMPLHADARDLLAELLPVVHLDFALSEVGYFQGATGSTADADTAYDTFLLGHAAWFDTAPGQAMREAVGRR